MVEMREMDLDDVVEIARKFTELAGWGYFRLHNVTYNEEEKIHELTAYVGAYNNQLIKFGIDDVSRKVLSYGADESNNK